MIRLALQSLYYNIVPIISYIITFFLLRKTFIYNPVYTMNTISSNMYI